MYKNIRIFLAKTTQKIGQEKYFFVPVLNTNPWGQSVITLALRRGGGVLEKANKVEQGE